MSEFDNFAKKYRDIKPTSREEEFQLAVIRAIKVFDRDLEKIKDKLKIFESRSL